MKYGINPEPPSYVTATSQPSSASFSDLRKKGPWKRNGGKNSRRRPTNPESPMNWRSFGRNAGLKPRRRTVTQPGGNHRSLRRQQQPGGRAPCRSPRSELAAADGIRVHIVPRHIGPIVPPIGTFIITTLTRNRIVRAGHPDRWEPVSASTAGPILNVPT